MEVYSIVTRVTRNNDVILTLIAQFLQDIDLTRFALSCAPLVSAIIERRWLLYDSDMNIVSYRTFI